MSSSRPLFQTKMADKRTIDNEVVPSVNVSPDEHSTPNIAQISPAPISSTSCRVHKQEIRRRLYQGKSKRIRVQRSGSGALRTSMSLLCMRTRRGTLTFLPVRALKMRLPLFKVPW